MATYEVIGNTTGLKIGDKITDDDLKKNHPGLGGAERLLSLGAIKVAGTANPPPAGETQSRVVKVDGNEGAPTDDEARASGGATGVQNTKTAGRR